MWYDVKKELPSIGEVVLCYWDEYGEDVYMICRMHISLKDPLKNVFKGVDPQVTHDEVTHWKYLNKP